MCNNKHPHFFSKNVNMAYVHTYSQLVPVNEAIRRVRLQIERRRVKQFNLDPESAHFQSLEREINSRRTIIEGLEQQNLTTYRRAWYQHQQPGNLNYSRTYTELHNEYRKTACEGEIPRKQLSPNAGTRLHIKATPKTVFFHYSGKQEEEDIGSGSKN